MVGNVALKIIMIDLYLIYDFFLSKRQVDQDVIRPWYASCREQNLA